MIVSEEEIVDYWDNVCCLAPNQDRRRWHEFNEEIISDQH